MEKVPWLNNLGINYLLGVDGMSTLMVFLVASVYFAGTLISWNISLRIKEYFVYFSLLVSGVAGAYVSLDLFFFFLFLRVRHSSYVPAGEHLGNGPQGIRGHETHAHILAGSAFMLVGFLAMYLHSNVQTFDIRLLGNLGMTGFDLGFPENMVPPAFPGLWRHFGPFSFSYLVAGRVRRCPHRCFHAARGRFKEPGRIQHPPGGPACLPLGRPLLAASAGHPDAHQHALRGPGGLETKGLQVRHRLFLCFPLRGHPLRHLHPAGRGAERRGHPDPFPRHCGGHDLRPGGTVYGKAHTRELAKLGGLGTCMPILGGLFVAAAMANVGLPGLSGFVGEFLIFLGAYKSGFSIFQVSSFPMAILAIVLTAIYYLRLGPDRLLWTGQGPALRMRSQGRDLYRNPSHCFSPGRFPCRGSLSQALR